MENMRMTELRALAREHRLRGYSWLRKAELIELIRNDQRNTNPPLQSWELDRPPPPSLRSGISSGLPQMSTWEPIDDRPSQPEGTHCQCPCWWSPARRSAEPPKELEEAPLSARFKFWGGGRVGGLRMCHPPYHPPWFSSQSLKFLSPYPPKSQI